MLYNIQEIDQDNLAIEVHNVSKEFDLDCTPMQTLKTIFQKRNQHNHKKFSALKNVSFSIKKGHTVGIIKRNFK